MIVKNNNTIETEQKDFAETKKMEVPGKPDQKKRERERGGRGSEGREA